MNDIRTSIAPPTRVRYSILALLCTLAMITYMDRAMYGSAKADIMSAVDRPGKIAYLLVAFQLAYALFEVPTGWMGDTYGPRKTLLRIVLWWSFFIALTACAGLKLPNSEEAVIGFGVLIAIQFLFGMGEAGAFPNITRSLYNWFPSSQRGSAQGTIWLSARFMGGLTPIVWLLLTDKEDFIGLSWRQSLWLFAGVAGAWCIVFYWWFRNLPEEHPAVNQAERDLISAGRAPTAGHAGVPWAKILRSRNLWFICGMYMVTNFGWYYLMYYFAGDLKVHFADRASGAGGKMLMALIGGSPLLIGMFGCMLGGRLTDWHVRRTGDRKWGRRIYAMFGYGMAGVCYLAATLFLDDFRAFAACIILFGFFNDMIMGPAWATCQDVGRRYAAIVAGCMNMIGNLGAAMGNYATGEILDYYGADKNAGKTVLFTLFGLLYIGGMLLWLRIDASKPIVDEDH